MVEIHRLPGCIGLGFWFTISHGFYVLISFLGFCVLKCKDKVSKIVSSLTKKPAISKLFSSYCIFCSSLFSLKLLLALHSRREIRWTLYLNAKYLSMCIPFQPCIYSQNRHKTWRASVSVQLICVQSVHWFVHMPEA